MIDGKPCKKTCQILPGDPKPSKIVVPLRQNENKKESTTRAKRQEYDIDHFDNDNIKELLGECTRKATEQKLTCNVTKCLVIFRNDKKIVMEIEPAKKHIKVRFNSTQSYKSFKIVDIASTEIRGKNFRYKAKKLTALDHDLIMNIIVDASK